MNKVEGRKELISRSLKLGNEIGNKKNQSDRVKLGKLGTGFAAASLLVACWGDESATPVTQKTHAVSDAGVDSDLADSGPDLTVSVDLAGGMGGCKGSGKPVFSSGKLVFCYTEPETDNMNWAQCLVNCKVKGDGYKMITKEDTYYLCMVGGSNPLTQKNLFSVRVGEMMGSAVALNPYNLKMIWPVTYPPFPYNDASGLTYGTDMGPGDINMDGGVPASGWTVCDSWKDLDKLTPLTYNFSPIAATGNNMSYGMGGYLWTTKMGCMCGKEIE